MNKRLLAVFLVVALALSFGCASARKKLEKRYAEGLKAFNRGDIESAGLSILWEQDLSGSTTSEESKGKTGWSLRRALPWAAKEDKVQIEIVAAYLYEKTLLMITADNVVWAFDRQSGAPQWVTQIPQLVIFAPAYFDTKFYCVSRTQLFVIDNHGAVTVGANFPFSVSKPLYVMDDYIYAVGSDGMLHKVDKVKLDEIWTAAVRTESVITDTPILLEGMLIFGTMGGQVLAVDRVSGGRRLDMKGFGPIAGSIVTDGQAFYFGSADYHLYCYSTLGTPVWRIVTEGVMALPPVLAGDTIYAELVQDGLIAVSRKTGDIMWRNGGAKEFVSFDAAKVLSISVIDRISELWVLEAATGKRLSRIDVTEFPYSPRNTAGDGLVYLVSRKGRIVCLALK